MPNLTDIAEVHGSLTISMKDGRTLEANWMIDPLVVAKAFNPEELLVLEQRTMTRATLLELEQPTGERS